QVVVGDVLVQDARHGRAQARQVGAAVTLRNIVGEAQHGLGVAVVPLHGDVHAHGGVTHRGLGADRKHIGVKHRFAAIDVLDKTLDAPQEGEVFFLALALVDEADLDAVVEERQLAQTLGKNVVMELDVLEDGLVGQEMHARALLVGRAGNVQGLDALALPKLHLVGFALAPDGQAQPLRQRIHARHAYAVQAARHFVGVVVELAAGVQLGHDDFSGAAAEFVVFVNVGGNAPAVVAD